MITVNTPDKLLERSANWRNLAFRHAFAIGHNTGLDRYSLYHAEVQKGVIEKFHPCLEFSRDIIRGLQENLAWPPSSGESYSPVH